MSAFFVEAFFVEALFVEAFFVEDFFVEDFFADALTEVVREVFVGDAAFGVGFAPAVDAARRRIASRFFMSVFEIMPPCFDASWKARPTSSSTASIDSLLRGLTATHDLPDMYGLSSVPIAASVRGEQQ